MENPTQLQCSAPDCSEPARWRYAAAFFWESTESALDARGVLRCHDHLSLDDLRWMPGLQHGMAVVVDPRPVSPGTQADTERSDTERMGSHLGNHLIDVAELRPSVTSDATALLQLGRGGRPPVPGISRGRHS